MAGSTYGKLFTITTWGESHGAGIGVVIDGCPAGLALDTSDIQAYLDRRKPGQSKFTTQRREPDSVALLSGISFSGMARYFRTVVGHECINNAMSATVSPSFLF